MWLWLIWAMIIHHHDYHHHHHYYFQQVQSKFLLFNSWASWWLKPEKDSWNNILNNSAGRTYRNSKLSHFSSRSPGGDVRHREGHRSPGEHRPPPPLRHHHLRHHRPRVLRGSTQQDLLWHQRPQWESQMILPLNWSQLSQMWYWLRWTLGCHVQRGPQRKPQWEVILAGVFLDSSQNPRA